jgi:alanine dehydrogenase
MKIAIAKETAQGEKRVLVLPNEVGKLVEGGNQLFVEKNAGEGMYIYDRDYEKVGAKIVSDRKELFGKSDLLVKLKVPTPEEFGLLENNILLSMFHHEQNKDHIYFLGKSKSKAVELESIINDAGERLIDATDITGAIGVLYSCQHLNKMPQDSKVLILGYGRVGSGAIRMCNQLGMNAKILRKSEYSHINHFLGDKDLLINAISWPKEERENKRYIVRTEMLDLLNPGAVILDLSVDFPNPIQTCRPTSISNPYYVERGKVHIGIYGYPGLVPVSSSERYSSQVLPIISEIACNKGLRGIEKRGELGKYINKAIVDPLKFDWKNMKPEELKGSLIE